MLQKTYKMSILVCFCLVASSFSGSKWVRVIENTQNWTGGDWKDTTKDSIAYDGQARNIDQTYFIWNSTANKLVNSNRFTNEFDTCGDVSKTITLGWNKEAGAWDSTGGTQWIRTRIDNHVTQIIQKHWSDKSNSQRWYNDNKYDITFANGDTSKVTYSVWDTTIGDWLNVWEKSYSFNSKHKVVQIVYNEWQKSDLNWAKISRTNYGYNSNDLLEADTIQSWISDQGGNYINGSRDSYTYDAKKRNDTLITQTWSSSKGIFINVSRTVNTYNDSDKVLSTYVSRWTVDPSNNGLWLYVQRTVSRYNSTHLNLIEERDYDTYDSSKSNWNKINEYSYGYDTNNNPSFFVDKSYDTAAKDYENVYRITYTYNTINLPVTIPNTGVYTSNKSIIFAQFQKNLIISGDLKNAVVSIFNPSGRLVKKLTASGNCESITWNYDRNTAGGKYFVNVVTPTARKIHTMNIVK